MRQDRTTKDRERKGTVRKVSVTSAFKYDIYKHRILQVLLSAYRSLTTRQIAKFSGISYTTARLHLKELSTMQKVQSTYRGNRIYWDPQDNEI